MAASEISQRVEAVRRFNRFYTRQIGLLTEQYLKTPFSVTQARVLYELAHHAPLTAAELASALDLDAGQLSRMLSEFARAGLVDKQPSATDGRKSLLSLTEGGQAAFATLNARSHNGIATLLERLPAADQNRLVEAMQTIQTVLGAPTERRAAYLLRPSQPGDLGWVVYSHGVLYAEEYRWDEQFEALVAQIVAHYTQNLDPKRERCWIAEKDGENVGSVFLVKQSDTVAKLRLLLVTPQARGLGLGTRLVDECIRFARQAGYQQIVLWTNSVLLAARHIYQKAGFRCVAAEAHHSFGHDLIGETWELEL